jgi:hypothetical protein
MMTGCWAKGKAKKYPYYMIHGQSVNIRKELLESTFVTWLNNFKLDVKYFEALCEEIKTLINNSQQKIPEQKLLVKNKISQLKEKQTGIIDKNLNGIIPDDVCRENINQISAEIYSLQQQISNADKVDFNEKEFFSTARKLMLEPGKTWKEASFKHKLILQSFYFPKGIEIDKSGSRTREICKLFKVKSSSLTTKFPNVDHRKRKSNTAFVQLSLRFEGEPDIHQTTHNAPQSFIEEITHFQHKLQEEAD